MSSAADLDLDGLIQSLPACKRCRDCRRGCDTMLPKCKQCTKAGAECIYYDHGRNQYLHRSYIAGLVDHVRRLTDNTPSELSPSVQGRTSQDVASVSVSGTTDSVVTDLKNHYEHHFAFAGKSYRYLGSEASLVKSPRLLSTAVQIPSPEDDSDWELSWTQSSAKAHELVEIYLEVIQPLYPVLDLSARYLSKKPPMDLTDTESFHLNMIYSIACHVMPSNTWKKHPEHHWNQSGRLTYQQANAAKYQIFAASKFTDAMLFLEAATSDATVDTLRSILLLAIYSLFDPRNGNIGQQVALAARLALTLDAQTGEGLGSKDAEMMRNFHTTIFCIENEVASTLDRPATFPEPPDALCFDDKRPADYLCSLYRLQYRFRRGDLQAKEAVKTHLPLLDDQGLLSPGLRMALHQTHLLLNPCWQCAWYVLEAVVSLGSIHIFLTPHWVYRAAGILIDVLPEVCHEDMIQLYANAHIVLSVASWKWPSSTALSNSLSELMRQAKAKHPEWASESLIHFQRQKLPT